MDDDDEEDDDDDDNDDDNDDDVDVDVADDDEDQCSTTTESDSHALLAHKPCCQQLSGVLHLAHRLVKVRHEMHKCIYVACAPCHTQLKVGLVKYC